MLHVAAGVLLQAIGGALVLLLGIAVAGVISYFAGDERDG